MSLYPSGNPASMGRRVVARLIDVSVTFVLVLVLNGAALAAMMAGGGGVLTLVALVVLALWSVFSFWAILARAALPGQLMLGLHHVHSESGQRAGGKTFLKYLVQAFTLGLAPFITAMSIQAPNRSAFDRLAGVTLVDPRAADVTPSAGEQVAAPPAGWQADESELTQGGASLGPAGVAAGGGMIQSVPFEAAGSQVVRNAPPAVRRDAGVVEPRTTAAAVVVPSIAASPTRSPQPVIILDSGETHGMSGPLILGRAPRQSSGLGHAELVVVLDRSVSANHLALGLDGGAPWVMDLNSTNGSWVEQDGRAPVKLEAMSRLALSPGAVVRMGQRRITVSAR